MDSTAPIYFVWNLIEDSPEVKVYTTHVPLVMFFSNLVVLLCQQVGGLFTRASSLSPAWSFAASL